MKYYCMLPALNEKVITNDYVDVFSRLVSERIVFLSEDIDADVATETAAMLLWLNKQDSKKEITFYINSVGGSVGDGLLTIYDTMQLIEAPIKTICIGEAYSSGAVLLAAGSPGLRFAYPSARLMIHSIQVSEMSGTQQEIQEETKRIKKLNYTLMEIIARHTGQPLRKIKKDCVKDKYLTPSEAMKYGIIDKIVNPSKNIPELILSKKR